MRLIFSFKAGVSEELSKEICCAVKILIKKLVLLEVEI